jgi:hypothetical protein
VAKRPLIGWSTSPTRLADRSSAGSVRRPTQRVPGPNLVYLAGWPHNFDRSGAHFPIRSLVVGAAPTTDADVRPGSLFRAARQPRGTGRLAERCLRAALTDHKGAVRDEDLFRYPEGASIRWPWIVTDSGRNFR